MRLLPIFLIGLALPALAQDAVVRLERSEGPAEIGEMRIYLTDGTHLTKTIETRTVTVIVRPLNGTEVTATAAEKVRAEALTCPWGTASDVREAHEGSAWSFVFECSRPLD
ncbi:hypothetical protein [Roseisalinus antarcticus]|uniref:Gram-negative bacterial tonB protein n=1 Tax=Roseisalinus antarcticus TaxID=254357 RepID=A0A1Y5SMV8_9RHOB|nr:hypothetical protein [Roseisalinus antarcticus]SLN41294.1 hypothetical protein ROA7023_01646 [Roseisalinus antarcticus]